MFDGRLDFGANARLEPFPLPRRHVGCHRRRLTSALALAFVELIADSTEEPTGRDVAINYAKAAQTARTRTCRRITL